MHAVKSVRSGAAKNCPHTVSTGGSPRLAAEIIVLQTCSAFGMATRYAARMGEYSVDEIETQVKYWNG